MFSLSSTFGEGGFNAAMEDFDNCSYNKNQHYMTHAVLFKIDLADLKVIENRLDDGSLLKKRVQDAIEQLEAARGC